MAANQILLLMATSILLLLLLFAAFVVLIIIQKNKQQAAFMEKQSLLQSLLEERERTMNEISVAVHDNLCQLLSFAQMNIKTAIEHTSDSNTRGLLDSAITLMTEIGDDMQHVGRTLSSEYIETRGFLNVLNTDLDYIHSLGKIKCHLDLEGSVYKLGAERELMMYRIAKEAICNAIKHAGAKNLYVAFSFTPDSVIMCIADDGFGLQKYREDRPGAGIIRMRQRATLLKGTLEISGNGYGGFSVTLTCPF